MPIFSDTVSLACTLHNEKAGARLRSEPCQRIISLPEQAGGAPEDSPDKVTLSAAGLDQSRRSTTKVTPDNPDAASAMPSNDQPAKKSQSSTAEPTPTEQQQIQQLRQRDQEVKTHEMAHLASASQYARGGPTYTYQQGPDGRRYAVGGEVPIDLSTEKTAEETILKMQSVKRAALAPANPSPADRSIAAAASALENQARGELQSEESSGSGVKDTPLESPSADVENRLAAPSLSVTISSPEPRHPFRVTA